MIIFQSSEEKVVRTDLAGRSQSLEVLEVFSEISNKETGETTRSTAKTAAYREKIAKKRLEMVKYDGKIHFFLEAHDIAAAADDLLKFVNSQIDSEVVPVGFDMEWPFNFTTGPQKTALIQICAVREEDLEVGPCYLFHVTRLTKLPPAFMAFLKHPKIRWHGVNIKNDFRKLQRDFPEVDSQELIDRCVDLGVYCNQVCSTSGRWSMERLVAYVVMWF
jgi:werner syndrome-like exonuclease